MTECEYKEYKRWLKEQFINRLVDEGKISEMLREVLTLEENDSATSERVLLGARRVEEQKVALNNIKEAKEFDCVRHSAPKHYI